MASDAPAPPTGALLVVGAAILREGRCLVALRASDRAEPDLWEFPGGKVEAGETGQQALVREIKEELGVAIDVGDFAERGVVRRSFGLLALDVYLAELSHGEPEAHEHQEIRWVTADELGTFCWAEADIPIWPVVQRLMQSEQSSSR